MDREFETVKQNKMIPSPQFQYQYQCCCRSVHFQRMWPRSESVPLILFHRVHSILMVQRCLLSLLQYWIRTSAAHLSRALHVCCNLCHSSFSLSTVPGPSSVAFGTNIEIILRQLSRALARRLEQPYHPHPARSIADSKREIGFRGLCLQLSTCNVRANQNSPSH